MKLLWLGYLVYSLGNCVMKLCIETCLNEIRVNDPMEKKIPRDTGVPDTYDEPCCQPYACTAVCKTRGFFFNGICMLFEFEFEFEELVGEW